MEDAVICELPKVLMICVKAIGNMRIWMGAIVDFAQWN